jgi:hypothetical protein
MCRPGPISGEVRILRLTSIQFDGLPPEYRRGGRGGQEGWESNKVGVMAEWKEGRGVFGPVLGGCA